MGDFSFQGCCSLAPAISASPGTAIKMTSPSCTWCLPLLSGLLGGFTHRQGHQKWVFWEGLAQENLDWSYWTLFSFQVTPGRTVTKGLWVSKAQGYKLHKHSCRKAPTWPIICNCSWTSISIVGTAKPHSVFPPPSGTLLPTPILEAKDHSS